MSRRRRRRHRGNAADEPAESPRRDPPAGDPVDRRDAPTPAAPERRDSRRRERRRRDRSIPGGGLEPAALTARAAGQIEDLAHELARPSRRHDRDGNELDPAEPTPRVRRRHRMAAVLMIFGFALLAFVTGLIVFNSVLMPQLIHGVGSVKVPDLANLTLEQAEQQLRPLGLVLSRAGERFDPSVPRGFVLAQDPPSGSAVRGGRRVIVVVSLGEEFSSVPALFGESQRSAEALLRSAGLRVGFITRAPSDGVGEGLVAGSDPGPESVLPHDGVVRLLVSTGASEESFVMPDLVGQEISGVRRQLEALGFKVVTPAGAAMGTITSQDPPAGSRIKLATLIVLQASGRVIP